MKLRVLALLCCLAAPAFADDSDLYLAPHPDARWWLSAQANAIAQMQPGFPSPYQGANSFTPDDHFAISFVTTVYGGLELWKYTAVVVAGESAGGGGLSQALGIAGFTNLDVVRNPTLGPTPYLGRAFVDQLVPLSSEWVPRDRDPLHVFRKVPRRRLEIKVGKLSSADAFDLNSIGTDSHLQFMNWAIDNNGAWDYAADTRGYTLGAIVEYAQPQLAIRFGELLMPTVANGIDYDWDIGNARGENLEAEFHTCACGRPGIIRLLVYRNLANMGNYAETNAIYREGITDVPDITADRVKGRTKHGVGLNLEQELPAGVRVFARLGWSDGKNESFAYTEIDNTILVGGDMRGRLWHRPGDKLGLAAVTNGLSDDHAQYLELGGRGFLLGDGKLNYGRETIVEAYYTARAYRGIFPALDVQLVDNPGYNRDRGPVVVGSVRLHVEI
ncbi:MAG TPA: carbohydrate porin [Kofleriaceae bacterium]